MYCMKCNRPVEFLEVGDLPNIIGSPVIIDDDYMANLVCTGCKKHPLECSCK